MTNKAAILEVLNEVNILLSSQEDVSYEITKNIRSSLVTHIAVRQRKRGDYYNIDYVSDDIEEKFKLLSISEFDKFPLKVGEITLRKFMADEGFKRGQHTESNTTNPNSKSIRLIAAFLILSDTNALTLQDIVTDNFSNKTAHALSKFIGSSDQEYEKASIASAEGVYEVQSAANNATTIDKIQLILEKSEQGSHLLVQEKFSSEIKNKAHLTTTDVAYGWCVLSSSGTLLIVLKDSQNERPHLYSSAHIQHNLNQAFYEKLVLQLNDQPYQSSNDSEAVLSSSEFNNFIRKKQFIFSRVSADILTFQEPIDAIKRKSSISIMNAIDKTRSSAVQLIQTERRNYVMDDDEKEKLSKEMLACIINVRNRDEDRFFELLDLGASINYRDPVLKATVIHAAGRFYVEFIEEILKRSHEEYDFLIRDKNGNLASAWAFPSHPQSPLYELMREMEIEYGRQRGIFPDPLRDRHWSEVFPDEEAPSP